MDIYANSPVQSFHNRVIPFERAATVPAENIAQDNFVLTTYMQIYIYIYSDIMEVYNHNLCRYTYTFICKLNYKSCIIVLCIKN